MGSKGRRTRRTGPKGPNPKLREQLRMRVGVSELKWGFRVPPHLKDTYLRLLDASDPWASEIFYSRKALTVKLAGPGEPPLSAATVTRHIAGLEALGLIEVRRGPVVPREGRKAGPIPRGSKGQGLWKRAFVNRTRFRIPADIEAAPQRPAAAPPASGTSPAAERPPRAQLPLLGGDDVDQVDGDRAPPTGALVAAHRLEQLRAELASV